MSNKTTPVIKQLNDEEMVAVEWLYCAPMEADAHDEGMTATEIEKMVSSFNANIDKIAGNIGHAVNVDGVHPVKAWVNECECYIGDQLIPEGTPLVKMQFTDPDLWELRKNGTLMGVSIGARGVIEEIEEE